MVWIESNHSMETFCTLWAWMIALSFSFSSCTSPHNNKIRTSEFNHFHTGMAGGLLVRMIIGEVHWNWFQSIVYHRTGFNFSTFIGTLDLMKIRVHYALWLHFAGIIIQLFKYVIGLWTYKTGDVMFLLCNWSLPYGICLGTAQIFPKCPYTVYWMHSSSFQPWKICHNEWSWTF